MADDAPDAPAVRLVTVAREYGSGGSDLARALGRTPGWKVLEDREIVRRVARELGVPERDVAARDERVATLAERLGNSLAGVFPELLLPPDAPEIDEDAVAEASAQVLRDAAEDPPVVVVGHGGMCLFAERPDAFHIRVTAPFEHRVGAVSVRLDLARDAAAEEIRARDRQRAAYVRRRFGVEWDDSTLYHLVLNSERIAPRRGAELLRPLLVGEAASGHAPSAG